MQGRKPASKSDDQNDPAETRKRHDILAISLPVSHTSAITLLLEEMQLLDIEVGSTKFSDSEITVVGRDDPAGRPQNLAGTVGEPRARPCNDFVICGMIYLDILRRP